MFLLPNQQLERCDRVMQQRVKPHIHTSLAACTLRSFHNPGEPVPSSEFLAKVRNGQVPLGLRTFSWRLSERFLVCSVLRSVRGRWSYTSQRR